MCAVLGATQSLNSIAISLRRDALGGLPDRQYVASFGIIRCIVQELLQQIDLDYYRSVRLLIVQAELRQLRQERTAPAGFPRRRASRIDDVAEDSGRMSSESA